MERFTLDNEQTKAIDLAFQAMPERDVWVPKLQVINERLRQVASSLFQLTRKSPEQTIALEKLREAQFWFTEAIRKYEL